MYFFKYKNIFVLTMKKNLYLYIPKMSEEIIKDFLLFIYQN
jgi:hypothetical protein